MIQRIGRKKFKHFAFDIESHNDSESIARKETSMWLGSFIDENSKVDDESSYMYSMDEFLSRLESESTPQRHHGESIPIKNVCVWIYNLSFEYSFLLPYMLKYGFKFKERITDDDEMVFNSVSTKSCSSVWQVQLKFHKKSGIIILKDLAKIYGGGLRKVAKAFNLPTQKGEIDYRLNRLHGHQVTKEEKEYCFKDTRIIIDILLILQERGDKDFFNVISMASYTMKKMLKESYRREMKPFQKYRENYPELGQEETDFLRRSVGGGITYAPKKWQFKEIDVKVGHTDARQMHPSQMYFQLFPYGKGEYFEGFPPMGKICCCRIRISYCGVKLHSIISLIGIDVVAEREIVVWDFEIPTMMKVYEDLQITYIDGYSYNARRLPFRKYIYSNYQKRLEAKRKKDDFNILYYKLLNNSAYGKFLEKPHNQVIENTINDIDIIDSNVIDKPLEDCEVNAKYTYLPVGSCIPAYSRVCLIETALKINPKADKITYFDTDSIFFIWDEETIENYHKFVKEGDMLGMWNLEEVIDKCQFTAPKRYKTETDGKVTIKSGGINFDEYISRKASEQGIDAKDYQVQFDEINIVSSSWKVQRAFRCKGGTIIEFQEKEMSIQDKYKEIYKANTKEAQ